MTSSVAQEIGQQLRDARQARGLSLHDVADRLKLSLRQLEAIEAGDLARLPGATFVRGFVRNYARFLELDSTPLMALLDQAYPPQPVDRVEPQAVNAPAGRKGAHFVWLLLPVLAVAVYLLWPSAAPQPVDGALAPMLYQDASAAPASAPAAVATPLVAASQPASAAPVAVPASAPVLAKPAQVLPASAAVAQAAPAAIGHKRLRLAAREDSWVSVVDASGKRLVFGTIAAGSSQEVAGVPPFKLKIGNAPAMALSYEGATVDLKDKTRGTTAKLELN